MFVCSKNTTRYGTETVSHEVLSRMKALMVESAASAASHSFLLDEDSALPFTQEDIASQMDDKASCWDDSFYVAHNPSHTLL